MVILVILLCHSICVCISFFSIFSIYYIEVMIVQYKSNTYFNNNITDNKSQFFILIFFLVGSCFGLYASSIAHEAANYNLLDFLILDNSFLWYLFCNLFLPLLIFVVGASVFGCFLLPIIVFLKGFSVTFSFYFLLPYQ